MSGRFEREALMAAASDATELDDFGDTDFYEPLDVLLGALDSEARLDQRTRAAAESTIVGLLVKRLRLVDDRARNPSIADEVITAPIVILGLPRTGSTLLHALMGQVDGLRTPLFWEMNLPSPPPEAATFTTDPRIAQVQASVDLLPSEMLERHPIAASRPEQCNLLSDWSFLHQALLAYYEIPSYWYYLLNADYTPAFEAHRRMLQQLQWHNPGRWVLKYPKHLIALPTLLATYPDAGLVWTHRDPAVVLPSVASFTGYIRAQSDPDYDPVRFGLEWAALEELVLDRGLAARDEMPDAERQILDVHYGDLMADPVGTVGAICDYFGVEYAAPSRARVAGFVEAHPRNEHGVHRYEPEDFGFDVAGLHRRFGSYMRRFDIQPERRR